ncbi:hypothetical protein QE152_g23203 [Popillia japonica]|uniref:Uncharacterized protein n=1 Tax=Popillia japonica TaxID=7064 RepID=A0AAW1KFW4_POPJA
MNKCCLDPACSHAVVEAASVEALKLSDQERKIILEVLKRNEQLQKEQQQQILLYGESAIFYKTPTRAFVQRSWEQQLARSQIQRHATSKQLKTYGKGKCNCITDTWTYVGESCLWACGPC